MKLNLNDQAILTLSSGILAGLGTTISLVCVPAILSSKDPLTVWKIIYNRGKHTALPTILITTGAALRCYFHREDILYLVPAALAATFIPFTLLCIKPQNDAMFGASKQPSTSHEDKLQLVKKWEQLQVFRTVLGISAFVSTVLIIHARK